MNTFEFGKLYVACEAITRMLEIVSVDETGMYKEDIKCEVHVI